MTTVALITSGAHSVANFRGVLIRELVARGVRVVALAPDWSATTRAATCALGAEPVDISLSRAGISPARDAIDTLRLTAMLRRLRPDATLTYFAKPNVYGTLAAWLAGVRRRVAMVEGLGFAFDNTGPRSARAAVVASLARTLFRTAFARADLVLFLNRDDERFFLENQMVASEKVRNIGGIGVDLDEFHEVPPVTDPVSFLLMARLLRGKGILEFAQAAALVKAKHPAARFVLLGDVDANPDSLRADEVQPWVDRGAIDWPGHVSDVRERLANASVFVLPAWLREGLPRSTQEAAAMGKPIITTDGVGCRDTVVDGVNGFLIPRRDVPALAAAMERFIERPDLIVSMGRASRAFAEAHYDGKSKSSQLADLLLI